MNARIEKSKNDIYKLFIKQGKLTGGESIQRNDKKM